MPIVKWLIPIIGKLADNRPIRAPLVLLYFGFLVLV